MYYGRGLPSRRKNMQLSWTRWKKMFITKLCSANWMRNKWERVCLPARYRSQTTTAKMAKIYFQVKSAETLIQWPPQIFDSNPIKLLWKHLECEVRKVYLIVSSKTTFQNAPQNVWNAIDKLDISGTFNVSIRQLLIMLLVFGS